VNRRIFRGTIVIVVLGHAAMGFWKHALRRHVVEDDLSTVSGKAAAAAYVVL